MFATKFTEHITNARAIVAQTLHLSTLLNALNASKGLDATSPSHHNTAPTSSTTSVASTMRPDASKIAGSAPHCSGATIVASVGFGYASYTGATIQQRLARLQATQFSRALASMAMPQSSALDADVDDEVPRATAPYVPVHWSMAPFLAHPANPITVATQSNKVKIGRAHV